MEGKENFEDYGIEGVNYTSSGDQALKCPTCTPNRKKKSMKSLSVNVTKGAWNCHHCGWKGGLKNYEIENTAIKPVVLPKREHQTNLTDLQINWFSTRGIKIATLERNKLMFEKIWMPQTEKEENAICFNYFRGDVVVNVKYRDGRKNFRQAKDGEKILYKLNDLKDKEGNPVKEAIITEGEIDALSYEEAGIKWAVSVPDGAPNPEARNYASKFNYITNCAEDLEKIEKFYLSIDNDEAGVKLREELSRRLGRHKCWIINYPEGCKDANQTLTEHGSDVLKKCVKEATPYPIDSIITVQDISEEIDILFDQGFDSGVKVGFDTSHTKSVKPFDDLISFKTGMLTVITGIPNHGKSNFVEELLLRLNVFHDWKVGLFSPEHYPMSILFQRIAKMYIGKQFFKGATERMSKEELDLSKDYLKDNYYFVRPEDENFTLEKVLEAGAGLVLRYGIKSFVIDPWNAITHDRKGMNDHDYTEHAFNLLNAFKQKYDVHVFILAHPIKMGKDAMGKHDVPNLYSVSGSSHWYNKPDNGMTIYRDFEKQEVQVHIQKIKYEHLGTLGTGYFYWNKNNSRYYPKGSEPFNERYGLKEERKEAIRQEKHEEATLPYKEEEDDFFPPIDDDDLPF